MIALILGGAPSVWDDLDAARHLVGDRRTITVAANLAGLHHDDPLDGWATLHAELISGWAKTRSAGRLFAPARMGPAPVDVVAERWCGSSGLYAAQCALFEMGASAVVLCGVPMDRAAGHFIVPGQWAPVVTYRQAFAAALPVIGGRTRSMGGWTRSLFGAPTAAWLDAVATQKPMGSTSPQHRNGPMHTVKNVSQEAKTFQEADPEGGFRRVTLQPGESGDFDIDPNQGRFQTGDLKVSEVGGKTAKVPAVRKPAAKVKPRGKATPKTAPAPLPLKPAPGVPLPEASDEA